MRLSLDLTPVLLAGAGIKNHTYHLAEALSNCAEGHALEYFPYLCHLGALNHTASNFGAAATQLRLLIRGVLNSKYLPLAGYLLDRTTNADLFHASQHCFTAPKRTPFCATVYDMTCWTVPEFHTPANRIATTLHANKILKFARGVIAISEYTRADACRILNLNRERVRVIYPGVSDPFFGVRDSEGVRNRYRLKRPFILYVGTIEPRKNIGMMLDAWAGLPAEIHENWDFVLAGPYGWQAEEILTRLTDPQSKVRYLGYVPECDLPELTAAATAFVYVSHYEGFGMPPAQALAAGVPVIASNTSSLPEVVGPGGIFVDPNSISELRDAMLDMLTSPSRRRMLASQGAAYARRYSWRDLAQQYWCFFEAVLGWTG
jgi:glycosyltransferase involved in cell wall biosynthesis